MPAYLTKDQFRTKSLIPASYVDEVEQRYSGFIDARLALNSGRIDGRLRKRYKVPFEIPAPAQVEEWLIAMTTMDVLTKRGVSPTDEQITEYRASGERAEREMMEAANSSTGLFDLPLTDGAFGIVAGGPRSYSEQSPYAWMDVQRDIGRNEDDGHGGGTTL